MQTIIRKTNELLKLDKTKLSKKIGFSRMTIYNLIDNKVSVKQTTKYMILKAIYELIEKQKEPYDELLKKIESKMGEL